MVYDTGIEQRELLCRCLGIAAFVVNKSGASFQCTYKECLCSKSLTAPAAACSSYLIVLGHCLIRMSVHTVLEQCRSDLGLHGLVFEL
jgi:hypothetical protein